MHDIRKYGGNGEDEADGMLDYDADDRMDDRENGGNVMNIDEENADSIVEGEDETREGDTSDIEMIDAVIIVETRKRAA